MKRVIERCPNCGVEHDEAHGGACEVCGTPLRFWCRVHGAQVGWLDAPVCPRCEAEAAAPAPSPPRRPRVPTAWPRLERSVSRSDKAPPPGAARDPRVFGGRGVEDLRPHVVTGAGVAWRLIRAFVAVLRSVVLWGVLGGFAGGVFAYSQAGDLLWTAMFGVMVGGGLGLLLGAIAALRILFTPSTYGRRG